MQSQILQLYRPLYGNSVQKKRLVKFPITGQKIMPHENLADKIINKRRMDTVTAKMAGPTQTIAQSEGLAFPAESNAMSSDFHLYFFNMPASRPVEKAICRL